MISNYVMGKFVDNMRVSWVIFLNFLVFLLAIVFSYLGFLFKFVWIVFLISAFWGIADSFTRISSQACLSKVFTGSNEHLALGRILWHVGLIIG